jgi:signal transduction histidine kinase
VRCRDELVRELFHELNQPLSSLTCSLELALESQKNAAISQDVYREVLIQSLAQTQLAIALAGDLQALSSSQTPDDFEVIDMNECLEEAITDFQPVAETAGITLLLSSEPCKIRSARQPLRQVLFRFMEHVLARAESGQTIPIELKAREGTAILTMKWAAPDQSSESRKAQLRWAVIKQLLLTPESILEEHVSGNEHSLVLTTALAS